MRKSCENSNMSSVLLKYSNFCIVIFPIFTVGNPNKLITLINITGQEIIININTDIIASEILIFLFFSKYKYEITKNTGVAYNAIP